MSISIEQLQALLQQQHQQQLQQLLQQQQQQFERAQIKLIEMFTQKLNMQNPGTDTCGPQASQTNALISSISDFQCDPMAGVTSESCYKKCEDIKDLSQYQRELFEASQSRLIKILEAKLSVQPSQFQFQPNQVCSPEPVFENGKDAGSESTAAAYDESEFCGRRNLGLNLADQEPITINDEDEQNPKVDFGERPALPGVTGPGKPTKPMTTPEMNLNTVNSMFVRIDNTPDEENVDIDQVSLSKRHFDNSAEWCTQSYAKFKSDQFVEEEQVDVPTDSEEIDSSEDSQKSIIEFYHEEEAQELKTPKRKKTHHKFWEKKKQWKSKMIGLAKLKGALVKSQGEETLKRRTDQRLRNYGYRKRKKWKISSIANMEHNPSFFSTALKGEV